MSKDYFSFKHKYYKLDRPHFTTIRGVSAARQYKEGQTVDIILQTGGLLSPVISTVLFQAEIERIGVMPLRDIPLLTLKDDAAFPGFIPRDHWDFIGLLNSFRQFNKIRTWDEPVTIFDLKKIEGNLTTDGHGVTRKENEENE